MLYGTVKYVLKADLEREVEVPWAGRVVFEEGDGNRMKFYQVYLVSFSSFLFVLLLLRWWVDWADDV